MIRKVCWLCDCCALAAVPLKLPRTLIGMAMSALACSTIFCASPSATPGARSNEMVLDSSPPSCEIEVGMARSDSLATAPSGTIVVATVLRGVPVDALRSAGLADVVAVTLPLIEPGLDGKYKSFKSTGPCA